MYFAYIYSGREKGLLIVGRFTQLLETRLWQSPRATALKQYSLLDARSHHHCSNIDSECCNRRVVYSQTKWKINLESQSAHSTRTERCKAQRLNAASNMYRKSSDNFDCLSNKLGQKKMKVIVCMWYNLHCGSLDKLKLYQSLICLYIFFLSSPKLRKTFIFLSRQKHLFAQKFGRHRGWMMRWPQVQ